jgi:hypothetical protein
MDLIQRNLILNETSKCIAKTYDWMNREDIGVFDVIIALEWYGSNYFY